MAVGRRSAWWGGAPRGGAALQSRVGSPEPTRFHSGAAFQHRVGSLGPARTPHAGASGRLWSAAPHPRPGVRHRSWNRCRRRGAGWQPARRLPAAAVSLQRASWPIANRPQLAKLPHNSALCLACPYARLPGTLPANPAGVHFCVAHPPRPAGSRPDDAA